MYQRLHASIPAKKCSGIASYPTGIPCAAAGKYWSNFQLWICLSANTTTLAHLNLTTMCFRTKASAPHCPPAQDRRAAAFNGGIFAVA
jgi:hypothetical protein